MVRMAVSRRGPVEVREGLVQGPTTCNATGLPRSAAASTRSGCVLAWPRAGPGRAGIGRRQPVPLRRRLAAALHGRARRVSAAGAQSGGRVGPRRDFDLWRDRFEQHQTAAVIERQLDHP